MDFSYDYKNNFNNPMDFPILIYGRFQKNLNYKYVRLTYIDDIYLINNYIYNMTYKRNDAFLFIFGIYKIE